MPIIKNKTLCLTEPETDQINYDITVEEVLWLFSANRLSVQLKAALK